jgi:hypothetical protein
MPFEYPKLKKNKPDLNWVWDQNLYLIELRDAIQQGWYKFIRFSGGPLRSQQQIVDELNAITNFMLTAESVFEVAKAKEQSLRIELDKRREYDKNRKKLKCS